MSLLRRIAPALALLVLAPLVAEFLLVDFSVRQLGLVILLLVIWFGVARTRFPGPPIGAAAVAARAAEIAAEEQAVGEA